MSHNKVSQTRGRRAQHRVTTKHADQLQAGVDRLMVELDVQPIPPYEEPTPSVDDGFGLAEVIAGVSLFAMVGLLNMYY